VTVTPDELAEDEIQEAFQAYQPVGCVQCNNTGYRGRMGLYEVLYMTRRGPGADPAQGVEQ
jgi:type II secretory ATPase GspE/PulE/Tfp pilus assembly ATPase PilB-like protein